MNCQISVIEAKDVLDVLKLLRRTFYIDEPMNKSVRLCEGEDDPCTEVEEYCKSSLLEGLSLKACDPAGNIVSVMVSGTVPLKETDNANEAAATTSCKNPKFQKILHILARRETGARLWTRYPDHRSCVEVKVAATEPSWRGRGLMNRLLDATVTLVKQKGVRLIRLDTSSYYSAKSAEKYGFTCVYKALYADIKLNGVPILSPEPPHLDDRVYIKELF